MSKYTPDAGFGTLFQPKQRKDGAPNFRGALRLPCGAIVGVVCWVKEGKNGKFLSLKIDDREGEFQAKELGLSLYSASAPSRADARSDGGERREQRKSDTFSDPFDDEIPF